MRLSSRYGRLRRIQHSGRFDIFAVSLVVRKDLGLKTIVFSDHFGRRRRTFDQCRSCPRQTFPRLMRPFLDRIPVRFLSSRPYTGTFRLSTRPSKDPGPTRRRFLVRSHTHDKLATNDHAVGRSADPINNRPSTHSLLDYHRSSDIFERVQLGTLLFLQARVFASHNS